MSQPWSQLDDQAETIRDSRANQLQSCRQRIALFKGLQVDCYEERALALEKIIQVVKSYIRSSLSPCSATASPNLSDSQLMLDELLLDDYGEYSEQLFYYLLTILRLSITCPYSDVRQTFQGLLSGLKDTTGILIPKRKNKSPSHFIALIDIFSLESNTSSNQTVFYPRSSYLSFSPWDQKQIPTTTSSASSSIHNIPLHSTTDFTGGRPSDEYVRQMMIKTFTDEGRLSNLYRILSFFPTFFEIYHLTYTKILKAPIGPLHRTWKAYLALMVASEQRCQYLVSVIKLDFLYNGGDPNWLLSLDYVPNKLRNISLLILKLSRQPWRLNTDDIHQLLAGGVMADAWSRGELVQATVIIATFLGLSSFILGCGIAPEIDMTGGFIVTGTDQKLTGIENELDLPTVNLNAPVDEEQQRFHTDHGIGLGVSTLDDQHQEELTEKTTQELIHKLKSKKTCAIKDQILESLEKMKIQEPAKMTVNTDFSFQSSEDEDEDEEEEEAYFVYEDLQRFIDPVLNESIQLEPFEQDHAEYMEFMLGEYCWEDHGCDLANHYLPGIGDDLVSEFTEAISITDWSIFHPVAEEVVDTSPLRYAIWHYTQKIMGVTKEDYSYSDIPTYLNARTTKYIEDLCLSPHKIQKNDWCNIGISLRPEEKCHVNLLIASARKQAVLCYGLCLISEV